MNNADSEGDSHRPNWESAFACENPAVCWDCDWGGRAEEAGADDGLILSCPLCGSDYVTTYGHEGLEIEFTEPVQ